MLAESGGPDPQAKKSSNRLAVCASTQLVHSLWWSRLELNHQSITAPNLQSGGLTNAQLLLWRKTEVSILKPSEGSQTLSKRRRTPVRFIFQMEESSGPDPQTQYWALFVFKTTPARLSGLLSVLAEDGGLDPQTFKGFQLLSKQCRAPVRFIFLNS